MKFLDERQSMVNLSSTLWLNKLGVVTGPSQTSQLKIQSLNNYFPTAYDSIVYTTNICGQQTSWSYNHNPLLDDKF